mmetsp:Transcript_21005/g.36133  ORF Transcript_21005/g.36133 Transcript_21005/m.36133 type:complete len:102 (+) Transcript_21005:37-342(+)
MKTTFASFSEKVSRNFENFENFEKFGKFGKFGEFGNPGNPRSQFDKHPYPSPYHVHTGKEPCEKNALLVSTDCLYLEASELDQRLKMAWVLDIQGMYRYSC